MDSISQIKQQLDIVDIIQSFVPLKKSGRNYKGVCPFHSEKTPSFMVSQDLQMFKCFGCGAAGDMFKFIEQIEGVEFGRALEILAERAGITLERHDYDPQSQLKKQIYYINETTSKFYHYLLTKHQLGELGLKYIKAGRHLTDETLDSFMLGYAPDTWDTLHSFMLGKGFRDEDMVAAGVIVPRQSGDGYIDKFRGRIVFPLTGIDGKIVGFTGRTIFNKDPKYLNTSETAVFHKSNFLFALDKAKVEIKHSGAVFVEGQMDTITAHQFGLTNVIASSGTSLTDNQLRVLARYTKDIVFCFDSDSAGVTAVYRAVELAEKQGFTVRVAIIPKPFKDLDEMLQKDVAHAKRLLNEDAVSVYDFFVVSSLKKYDKTSALGKKAIMEELVPIFSKVSNPVILDHYAKNLAESLELAEETVRGVFKNAVSLNENTFNDSKGDVSRNENAPLTYSKNDPELYFMALLLKANLDMTTKLLYKTTTADFQNSSVREIFTALKESLQTHPNDFNINHLQLLLSGKTLELFTEMCLVDFDSVEGKEALAKELEQALARVKSDSTKLKLKKLSEAIKLAEMENNSDKVLELTKSFETMSKDLRDLRTASN